MAKSKYDEKNHPALVVNRWDELPEEFVKTKTVKQVDLDGGLESPGLKSLVSPFVSDDRIKPSLNGLYVDKDVNVIVATDAHYMLCMPNYGLPEGLWNFNRYLQPLYTEIKQRYPDYKAVLPSDKDAVYPVDFLKLRTYCNAVILGEYAPKYLPNIQFIHKNKEKIGFNAEKMMTVCDAMMKLGHRTGYIGLSESTRPATFSILADSAKNMRAGIEKETCILLMPTILEEEEIPAAQNRAIEAKFNIYYDFSKDEIVNADGSIADIELPEPGQKAGKSKGAKAPRVRKTDPMSKPSPDPVTPDTPVSASPPPQTGLTNRVRKTYIMSKPSPDPVTPDTPVSASSPPQTGLTKKQVLERIKSLHLAKKYASTAEKKAISERMKAMTISLKYL